jgi:hypothetical protein
MMTRIRYRTWKLRAQMGLVAAARGRLSIKNREKSAE